MRRQDDIERFLSMNADNGGGGKINPGEEATDEKAQHMLRAIWSQSEHLKGVEEFNTDAAWGRISDAIGNRSARRVRFLRTAVVASAAILLVLVFATRFLKQDVPGTVEPKSFVSLADASIYAEDHLFDLAEAVMAEARSNEFEQRIIEMAGERFDGETNVLVQEVLAGEAQDKKWMQLLNAFRDVENANYYPQIYIPDYDNYSSKSVSKSVVIHVVDEPTASGEYIYDAFKPGRNGKLKFYKRVSESDIADEKIWVFSLNENVDSDGRRISNLASINPNSKGINGRIAKMRINNPKESWAGGASEVHIRAHLQYWNGVNYRGEALDVPCDRTSFSPRGLPVRTFTRQEIANGELFEINYHLHDNWNVADFLNDEVAYVLVLFESDVWPNLNRQATYQLPNGDQRGIVFNSSQDVYDVAVIFGSGSPEGWSSPAYPDGIPDSLLIDRFAKTGNADIFYNTEIY